MHPAEAGVHEVDRQLVLVVLDLLREATREARRPSGDRTRDQHG
jgi:hypothetical protein